MYVAAPPHTRARTWPTLLLVFGLLLLLAFAPSLVARAVTAAEEPVDFLRAPHEGWRFAALVLSESIDAKTPSPGAALDRANEIWAPAADDPAEEVPTPESVRLVYAPGADRVDAVVASTELGETTATIDPPHALAWLVTGRYRSGQVGVIGALDYASGEAVWDVRDNRSPRPR